MPGSPGMRHDRRLAGCRACVLAGVLVLAAALAGCGGSGGQRAPGAPPPLAVRCTGRTLPGPDTSDIGLSQASNDFSLAPPVTAVAGVPYPSGPYPDSEVTRDAEDPADPSLSYAQEGSGYQVQLISGLGGGQPVWSTALSVPRGLAKPAPMYMAAHQGYAVVTANTGSPRSQATGKPSDYIGAVSSAGQPGPGCAVPDNAATSNYAEMLPHAGVLLLQNPASPNAQDNWLDGYSTATGKRLWSILINSDGDTPPDVVSVGDTVYVWLDDTGQTAAYNARTGKQLWATRLNSSPGIGQGLLGAFGGRVYMTYNVSGSTGELVALSGATGSVEWKHAGPPNRDYGGNDPNEQQVTSVGTGQVLLSDADNNMEYLFSARTGALLTSVQVNTAQSPGYQLAQLCYPGGQAAVAVPGENAIYVLSADPADDRTIPIPPGPPNLDVAITATAAYVYQDKPADPVYGYDLATGKLLWTLPVPASVVSNDVPGGVAAFDGGFVVGRIVYR